MRTIPISELRNLESGEIIPAFEGTVTKVYEQKHGPGEYGEWYLQNMIVEDGDAKVQVTWSGEDDMSNMEGKRFIFESSQTKHGLQGCKWDVRTSNGKRYEGVKLTGSCKIKKLDAIGEFEHGGERQTGEANPAARRDDPPTQNLVRPPDPETEKAWTTSRIIPLRGTSTAAPTVQPTGAAPDESVMMAKRHIMQAANLMLLAMESARYVAVEWDKRYGCELPNEHFQALCHSFFIEASSRRTTDGVYWWSYIDKMPEKPIP